LQILLHFAERWHHTTDQEPNWTQPIRQTCHQFHSINLPAIILPPPPPAIFCLILSTLSPFSSLSPFRWIFASAQVGCHLCTVLPYLQFHTFGFENNRTMHCSFRLKATPTDGTTTPPPYNRGHQFGQPNPTPTWLSHASVSF
jgi:hypothetical protein